MRGLCKMLMLAVLSFIVSGVCLIAAETATTDTTAYVAVPMHTFNRLIGNKPEKKSTKYFIYQDGKLVKCEANIPSLKKNAEKKDGHGKRGKGRLDRKRKGHGDKIVLLTRDQMNDLMKQKLEKKVEDFDSSDSKMAKAFNELLKTTPVVKVNGKDAKVVSPRSMFKDCRKGKNCSQPPESVPADAVNQ